MDTRSYFCGIDGRLPSVFVVYAADHVVVETARQAVPDPQAPDPLPDLVVLRPVHPVVPGFNEALGFK